MLNRFNVLNDPVNAVDPWGLANVDLPPGERARRIFKVRDRQRIERWNKMPKNNKEWTDLFNQIQDFESDWGSTFWNEYQKKYLELKEKDGRNKCH